MAIHGFFNDPIKLFNLFKFYLKIWEFCDDSWNPKFQFTPSSFILVKFKTQILDLIVVWNISTRTLMCYLNLKRKFRFYHYMRIYKSHPCTSHYLISNTMYQISHFFENTRNASLIFRITSPHDLIYHLIKLFQLQ